MNTNLIHNIINIVIAVVAAFAVFDWSVFFDAETAAGIVGGLSALKIVMNLVRDGLTGLWKTQPPVQ